MSFFLPITSDVSVSDLSPEEALEIHRGLTSGSPLGEKAVSLPSGDEDDIIEVSDTRTSEEEEDDDEIEVGPISPVKVKQESGPSSSRPASLALRGRPKPVVEVPRAPYRTAPNIRVEGRMSPKPVTPSARQT